LNPIIVRLSLTGILASTPLFGWGAEGHVLVARLAAAHLTPAAAAQVQAILGPDATLMSISSWADQVRNSRRETGPWHYVDIPINQRRLDMARDCKNGDCVIAKINEFRTVLADSAAPPVQRREALMFLVHFIGDMHQPLHSTDNHDRGGNDVRLDFFGRNSNLHSVWDSGLLSRMPAENELFAAWSKDLSNSHAKKWGRGTPRGWAEQTHKAGVQVVYGKLPKDHPAVTPQYEKLAQPLIRQQIERAAARLAATLNAALDHEGPAQRTNP
jgi:hypothetical protein